MALFIMFITYRYTNGMCSSIYSKDNGNCSLSPWQCSWCSLHMGIPTECVYQYIPKTIGIVLLFPGTIHSVHYIRVYQGNVFIGIFQRPWELFPFSLVLFMVFIIYGYNDRMCSSIYSRYYGNCSFFPWNYLWYLLHTGILMKCFHWYILEIVGTVPFLSEIVHNIHYIQIYWKNMYVCVLQRLWELFPSQCADN